MVKKGKTMENNEAAKMWEKMTGFMKKFDELRKFYDENIAHQFFEARVTNDTDDDEADEILDVRATAENAWYELDGALNEMCCDIVNYTAEKNRPADNGEIIITVEYKEENV